MRYLKQNNFSACYGALGEDSREFDVKFWQQQGSKFIFKAADDMIRDYFLMKGSYVDEPRLQRTVESFEKAPM